MTRVAAAVLAVLGLLPLANWIAGGHAAPWYRDRLEGWVSGGAIAVGVAVICVIATRRWPALWRGGAWQRVAVRWRQAGLGADLLVAFGVLAVCIVIARQVLSARPLLIDEIIQVYQARIFASGQLWLPAPAYPEFTSAQHLLDWGGKVFGQFPAGGPAFLAIGAIVGAEWLVGPIAAAVSALLFARLLRRIEPRDGTAFAALLLFAFAPFALFLGGSAMNHVTTTMALVAAALLLARTTADDGAHFGAAFACGVALGVAAAVRPLDGIVYAIPTAVWLAWRARRGGPHFRTLLASGFGVALPLAALLLVNASQTGELFTFGYLAMWGATHELGFHASPWGDAHTPLRGLELVNLYLLRLQTYLYEGAAPSLLFATGALALARRATAFDRWWIACAAGLLIAYFAYWHDGFYLGPRFMLPLVPLLALWTARLPSILAERSLALGVQRGVVVAGMVSLLIGAVTLVPIRAQQYHNGMLSMRIDINSAARDAGVHDALVLVRESWGAQVMARLWAAGVSRPEAESIYRSADICGLERALSRAERDGIDAVELGRRLAPLRADSARLIALQVSPDTTPRVVPGSVLRDRCLRRLLEDRAGFTLFPPLLLARGEGNIYLRDLHARDSLALKAHSGRPVWLLIKPQIPGAAVKFLPVDLDSMRREWAMD